MTRNPNELLVAVPVYGQIEYTHDLVGDLEREGVDYAIIDNGGDYSPISDEKIYRPGHNLGWAGGSNYGFRLAFSQGYRNAMTLNNDVRLSKGYFDGLLDERLPKDHGIVCGLYDDHSAHTGLLAFHNGPADDYEPRHRYRPLTCVDGTGLMITCAAWTEVGGLDERTFGKYSWGADIDLCIRVRTAGYNIYATEMSFLNHFGRKTAETVTSHFRYAAVSGWSMRRGLRKVHGRDWAAADVTEFKVIGLDDHQIIAEWTTDDYIAATRHL